MNNKYIPFALLMLIVVAMTGTYSNHFHNDFHFDDSHSITDNGFIRDLKNIPLFFKDVKTSSSMPTHQGYRPVVTTTLAIDYALSMKKTEGKNGYDTFWYHVSNFTWFVIIVVLFYYLQLTIYNSSLSNADNRYFALLGCAWYGLHTVNAETVNYIISRSDILSTLAIVSSFFIYLTFEKLRKYYLYVIPVAIGMLAKETTIMFAPALIAYDYMLVQQKSLLGLLNLKEFKSFIKSLTLGLPALLLCVALAAYSMSRIEVFEMASTSGGWYKLTQPYILLHYISQFFLPFGLTADTDIPMIYSLADDRLFIGFAFLALLLYVIFKTSEHKAWRPFSFGLVWFLLMLLPTSLVSLAEVTNDHRVFLPYIGLVISMVCLVSNINSGILKNFKGARIALVALLILAIGGYAYGTYQRNIVWAKDETLWKDVTEKSPNNGRGWMNYGLTLMGRGDYTNAEYCYNQALKHTPNYYILHVNIAILQEATGRKAEAEEHYKQAVKFGPGYVEAYYYYARFLYNSGRTTESEIYTNKGLEIFEGHLYSRYLLMDIHSINRDWQKLAVVAQRTLDMYPNDVKAANSLLIARNPDKALRSPVSKTLTAADLLNQSLALYNAGKFRECISTCYKAIALQPNYVEAYNNICSAHNQLLEFDSAVAACTKAVELRSDYTLAKNNLNWAKSQLKK
jgi:tetratricopeptide (TPR) repeat protein